MPCDAASAARQIEHAPDRRPACGEHGKGNHGDCRLSDAQIMFDVPIEHEVMIGDLSGYRAGLVLAPALRNAIDIVQHSTIVPGVRSPGHISLSDGRHAVALPMPDDPPPPAPPGNNLV